MAVAALQQTMREFHVDPSRVYLTGLSMANGPGTSRTGIPSCSPPSCRSAMGAGLPAIPRLGVRRPGYSAAVMTNLVQRLGKVPVWIFTAKSPGRNVNGSREPAAALKAAGADVHYTELLV